MIVLDYRDSRPLYEQVAERLRELMFKGALPQDAQLPSVRSLATELSINPNTIQRAYGELERGGFIYMVKGRGSFVGSIRRLREAKREELAKKLGVVAKEAISLELDRDTFVQMADQECGKIIAGQPHGSGQEYNKGDVTV